MNVMSIKYKINLKSKLLNNKSKIQALLGKKKKKRSNNKFKHNLQINCEYFQNELLLCVFYVVSCLIVMF